jgi:hypothetical protein
MIHPSNIAAAAAVTVEIATKKPAANRMKIFDPIITHSDPRCSWSRRIA